MRINAHENSQKQARPRRNPRALEPSSNRGTMPVSDVSEQLAREVSSFLILLIFITTLGPFQFGYHLVCHHLRSCLSLSSSSYPCPLPSMCASADPYPPLFCTGRVKRPPTCHNLSRRQCRFLWRPRPRGCQAVELYFQEQFRLPRRAHG